MPGAALSFRRRAALLSLLCLAACEPAAEAPSEAEAISAATRSLPPGQGFDFYVLALSWSPSYCEAEGAEASAQQCEGGRPYAFVVHGLWPQFERGYPEHCPTDARGVPSDMVRGLLDIMPSDGLIRHQWRKHGTCSGLDQAEYFATVRQARDHVQVPAQFDRLEGYRSLAPAEAERAFLQSNPGLPADGVAVTCDGRFLREVRVCLSKTLQFRSCPEVDRRACRAKKVVMPPVRGG